MSHAAEALLKQALELPKSDRLALADQLVASVEPGERVSQELAQVREMWDAEIERRCQESDAGKAIHYSWEQIKAALEERRHARA